MQHYKLKEYLSDESIIGNSSPHSTYYSLHLDTPLSPTSSQRLLDSANRIYVIADVHGDPQRIEKLMSALPSNLCEDDIVIIAGDCGLMLGGFYNRSLIHMMGNLGPTFIAMRGNHDTRYWRDFSANLCTEDGSWESSEPFASDDTFPTRAYAPYPSISSVNDAGFMVLDHHPRVWFVRDEGQVAQIGGLRFAFIPGGFSVDGQYRRESGTFEKGELLSDAEKRIICDALNDVRLASSIDVIISHVAPAYVEDEISFAFLDCIDQSTVDHSQELFLDDVVSACASAPASCLRGVVFGHYHRDKAFESCGVRYVMTFDKPVQLK